MPLRSKSRKKILCVFTCVYMCVFIWAGVHAHVRIHLLMWFLSNISYFLQRFIYLFKFWGCSMFICQSCRCVSSILHLCVKQRGVGERKGDMACRSRRREPAQVRWGRKRQEGGADVHGLSSRGGTIGRRGREELGGLVGWRRWGSPTAIHTQTHRNRYKGERMGTSWISVFKGVHMFLDPRVNSCM